MRPTIWALLAATTACGLLSGLDRLNVEDAAAGEAGSDVVPALDAGLDADGGTPGAFIANAGSAIAPTGNAQQTHLVWAQAVKQWWLFYIDDDPGFVKTVWSSDFVTWAPGQSLQVTTNGGDGRNFSVAYALLGQTDIVHIVLSIATPIELQQVHGRATIGKGTIAFDKTTIVSSAFAFGVVGGSDGPSVAIATSGQVADVTGFATPPDGGAARGSSAFLSATNDTGGVWADVFSEHDFTAPANPVRAHAVSAGTNVLFAWDSADTTTDPTNVIGAGTIGTIWTPGIPLFTGAAQDVNDWAITNNNGDYHVLRARLDGTYEDFVGKQMTVVTLPLAPRAGRTGLPLAADGKSVYAFDQDKANTLRVIQWNGNSWGTSWTTINTSAASRTYLSTASVPGSALASSGGLGLIWTYATTSGNQIKGQRYLP